MERALQDGIAHVDEQLRQQSRILRERLPAKLSNVQPSVGLPMTSTMPAGGSSSPIEIALRGHRFYTSSRTAYDG